MEMDDAIAERARTGQTLTRLELESLDAADVLSLGMLADEVRRARVGDTVGYTRVTTVGEDPLEGGAVTAAAAAGGGEVRMTALGATLRETVERIGRTRRQVGSTARLTGFSLADVIARDWEPLPAVLSALAAAGLDALAEAPVDLVSPAEVAAAVAAGLGPAMLTVQRRPEDRVALLLHVRALAEANPSLRRFAPLAREQSVAAPTTGYQDVRLVALARLALPSLDCIDVDWQQYGPKLAQVALMFGANHLDRVSPVDDPALGPRRATVEEVRRNIEAAGLRPVDPGEAA